MLFLVLFSSLNFVITDPSDSLGGTCIISDTFSQITVVAHRITILDVTIWSRWKLSLAFSKGCRMAHNSEVNFISYTVGYATLQFLDFIFKVLYSTRALFGTWSLHICVARLPAKEHSDSLGRHEHIDRWTHLLDSNQAVECRRARSGW